MNKFSCLLIFFAMPFNYVLGDLRLAIIPQEISCFIKEPIPISISVSNTSARPISFFRRLSFKDANESGLSLRLIDVQSGKEADLKEPYIPIVPAAFFLKPQDSTRFELDVCDFFVFDKTGKYKIMANYDLYDYVPYSENGKSRLIFQKVESACSDAIIHINEIDFAEIKHIQELLNSANGDMFDEGLSLLNNSNNSIIRNSTQTIIDLYKKSKGQEKDKLTTLIFKKTQLFDDQLSDTELIDAIKHGMNSSNQSLQVLTAKAINENIKLKFRKPVYRFLFQEMFTWFKQEKSEECRKELLLWVGNKDRKLLEKTLRNDRSSLVRLQALLMASQGDPQEFLKLTDSLMDTKDMEVVVSYNGKNRTLKSVLVEKRVEAQTLLEEMKAIRESRRR